MKRKMAFVVGLVFVVATLALLVSFLNYVAIGVESQVQGKVVRITNRLKLFKYLKQVNALRGWPMSIVGDVVGSPPVLVPVDTINIVITDKEQPLLKIYGDNKTVIFSYGQLYDKTSKTMNVYYYANRDVIPDNVDLSLAYESMILNSLFELANYSKYGQYERQIKMKGFMETYYKNEKNRPVFIKVEDERRALSLVGTVYAACSGDYECGDWSLRCNGDQYEDTCAGIGDTCRTKSGGYGICQQTCVGSGFYKPCDYKPSSDACYSGDGRCAFAECIAAYGCGWSCDASVCASAETTSQACGSTTVTHSCTNECGGTNTWYTTSGCRECQTSYNCGDNARDCGGSVCRECGPSPSSVASVCGNWTQTYNCSADVSGCNECGPTISAWSAWSASCGTATRSRTCSEDCGSDNCSGVLTSESNFFQCAPTLGSWSTCDANHKRTRTCVDTDGPDDGNDCASEVLVEDCIGTIQGTLFDASDLSSCPATIGTDPGYAPLRLGSAAFGILGLWPAITAPVSTDANGNYTEQVYASTVNGTYSFDYASLVSSGRASGVKLQCQGASVSVTTQGQTVTKDTGFWRVYSGWWQAVGGSVYARSGVRSYIPASVTPAANQKLILANAGGRVGVLSHGFVWQGTELGTNPNAGISSALWRIQSLYEGLRYDFNFYKTRMDVFPFTAWDGGAISYSDGGRGYQIFKHTGDVTLNYSGPTGTQKVILLVDGNVTVSGNVTVPSGAFLGVIAKNSIIFNSNLTAAQGWFVAESVNVPCKDTVAPIGTCDKTDAQFDGQGSFVGWTGINLSRDMGVGNNTIPAEKFTYRVDMALNAPTPIKVFAKKFSPFIP